MNQMTGVEFVAALAEKIGSDWRCECLRTVTPALFTYSVSDSEGCQSGAVCSVYITEEGYVEKANYEGYNKEPVYADSLHELCSKVAAEYEEEKA